MTGSVTGNRFATRKRHSRSNSISFRKAMTPKIFGDEQPRQHDQADESDTPIDDLEQQHPCDAHGHAAADGTRAAHPGNRCRADRRHDRAVLVIR
jgi:hypothetical protein